MMPTCDTTSLRSNSRCGEVWVWERKMRQNTRNLQNYPRAHGTKWRENVAIVWPRKYCGANVKNRKEERIDAKWWRV